MVDRLAVIAYAAGRAAFAHAIGKLREVADVFFADEKLRHAAHVSGRAPVQEDRGVGAERILPVFFSQEALNRHAVGEDTHTALRGVRAWRGMGNRWLLRRSQ